MMPIVPALGGSTSRSRSPSAMVANEERFAASLRSKLAFVYGREQEARRELAALRRHGDEETASLRRQLEMAQCEIVRLQNDMETMKVETEKSLRVSQRKLEEAAAERDAAVRERDANLERLEAVNEESRRLKELKLDFDEKVAENEMMERRCNYLQKDLERLNHVADGLHAVRDTVKATSSLELQNRELHRKVKAMEASLTNEVLMKEKLLSLESALVRREEQMQELAEYRNELEAKREELALWTSTLQHFIPDIKGPIEVISALKSLQSKHLQEVEQQAALNWKCETAKSENRAIEERLQAALTKSVAKEKELADLRAQLDAKNRELMSLTLKIEEQKSLIDSFAKKIQALA